MHEADWASVIMHTQSCPAQKSYLRSSEPGQQKPLTALIIVIALRNVIDQKINVIKCLCTFEREIFFA